MQVQITVAGRTLIAELDDNEMAEQVAAVLPITASASVWGDEIYFEIPVSVGEMEEAVEEVEIGTLAYWPPGNAMCIFYGRTPVSTSEKPRAYSPANVFGLILGDATELKGVSGGSAITVVEA